MYKPLSADFMGAIADFLDFCSVLDVSSWEIGYVYWKSWKSDQTKMEGFLKKFCNGLIKGYLMDVSGLFTNTPTRWRYNEREIE